MVGGETELEGRGGEERKFFIDNQLVRICVIIVMIRWTGLAPWEFEIPFPDGLTSAFLVGEEKTLCYEVSESFFSILWRPPCRTVELGGFVGSKRCLKSTDPMRSRVKCPCHPHSGVRAFR